MADPTLQQALGAARRYADRLETERENRPSGLHEDKRVATEIADHMWDLGQFEKRILEQNERWRLATQENLKTIDEIRAVFALLQVEMDIATNRPPASPVR